jgi:hypothetical protein
MADQNRNEDQNHEGDSSTTAAAAATNVPDGNSTRGENNNVNRKDSFMLKVIYKNFSF